MQEAAACCWRRTQAFDVSAKGESAGSSRGSPRWCLLDAGAGRGAAGRTAGLGCTAAGDAAPSCPSLQGAEQAGRPPQPSGRSGTLRGGGRTPGLGQPGPQSHGAEILPCGPWEQAGLVGTALRPGFLINELLETPGELWSLRVAGTLGVWGRRQVCSLAAGGGGVGGGTRLSARSHRHFAGKHWP